MFDDPKDPATTEETGTTQEPTTPEQTGTEAAQ